VHRHNLKRIDAIKIDIEGSELPALEGMRRTLQEVGPDVVIEANALTSGYSGYSFHVLLRFLETAGYQVFRIYNEVLSPFHAGGLQECVSCDYLATRRDVHDLAGKTGFQVRPMTEQEVVSSIQAQARFPEVHWRYVASLTGKAPAFVKESPLLEGLLREWSELPANDELMEFIRVGSSWPVDTVD
jgi:hypothetical protein